VKDQYQSPVRRGVLAGKGSKFAVEILETEAEIEGTTVFCEKGSGKGYIIIRTCQSILNHLTSEEKTLSFAFYYGQFSRKFQASKLQRRKTKMQSFCRIQERAWQLFDGDVVKKE